MTHLATIKIIALFLKWERRRSDQGPDHAQLTFRLKVFWHLIKNWNFQITLFSLKTFLVCPKGTTNKKLHCKKNAPMYVAQKKICLLKVLGSKRQRLWSSSSKTVVQGRSMCCISQFVGQKKNIHPLFLLWPRHMMRTPWSCHTRLLQLSWPVFFFQKIYIQRIFKIFAFLVQFKIKFVYSTNYIKYMIINKQ